MVLWSLSHTASSAPVFRDAEYFAINVLAAEDQLLSGHFATTGIDKFTAFAERFTDGLGGVPILTGSVATFQCHSRHRYYGGDHVIVIGVVERYTHHPDRVPLLFHRGRYTSTA
jgi:flavin reductase (DIM6/NTAB) family NADH-FMN oxidoreductase RutF